jgi:hypothetical protein
MALLGDAAITMWADFVPEIVQELGDWHTHEHMPERLGIPGFLRGTRWSGGGAGASHFIMYELASLEVFASAAYLERLNNPTPWSRKMTPHHRSMVRSPCRVVGGAGAGVGAALLTLRLSARPGEADRLRDGLLRELLPELARRPGLAAAHLLVSEPKVMPPQTEEQRMRGGDAIADWVLLVHGYDAEAVAQVSRGELGAAALVERGAAPGTVAGVYRLDFALTKADLRAPA